MLPKRFIKRTKNTYLARFRLGLSFCYLTFMLFSCLVTVIKRGEGLRGPMLKKIRLSLLTIVNVIVLWHWSCFFYAHKVSLPRFFKLLAYVTGHSFISSPIFVLVLSRTRYRQSFGSKLHSHCRRWLTSATMQEIRLKL